MGRIIKYFLYIVIIFLTGCTRYDSILNHKGNTVVNKKTYSGVYNVELRAKSYNPRTGNIHFILYNIQIPKYEYDQIKIGDIIK